MSEAQQKVPAATDTDAHVARRIAGRYTVLGELGRGGMGSVYRAHDESSAQPIAMKQLRSSQLTNKRKQIEALFEREYHTLVRLKHPRIIEVYDYGVTDAGPYYTMELLEGKDLYELGQLPYRDACRHARDVASSLALLHAHRLVHRDVSPRNVRLGQDGRAKLIDFGALTAFGPTTSIVGTPMCMAPETLRRMPLDHRTDLFGLGVVLYFALTGEHAYPARKIEDLPALWRRPPARPIELVPDLPEALDALVMSLLNVELLSRPESAGAVIERLTQIAELPPEEQLAVESYLSSSRMVGRQRELAWVERRIGRALDRRGGQLLIEGAPGIGKTRLLHEITLSAQLRGMLALKADAQASGGPFGVATALALQLLTACPELAEGAASADRGLLARLSPELHDRLSVVGEPQVELARNPGERRARFQAALQRWFLAIAAQQPLLLAVDNIQSADDDSAAFLAALGVPARKTQLAVLVTLRSGEPVAAEAPLRVLREQSSQLKLGALGRSSCEELIGSLFGGAANSGRLARAVYDKSAGNPQLCTELAQLLVRKQIAKYVGGSWVLPFEISADELPSRIEEILAARLVGLSPAALSLAEALSLSQKPVAIERCLELAGSANEGQTYAALDQLVADQMLLIDGGHYRFGQESVRAALLAQIDPVRRRAMHLRAAETLLADPDASAGTQIEAADHLMQAGQEGRGADIVARAGRAFLQREGAQASVEQIVKALDLAIDVYTREGRSDYALAGLLFPIVPLAFYADYRLVLKHSDRAIDVGLKISGLGLTQQLRPWLGSRLALRVGLLAGDFQLAPHKKRGVALDMKAAIAAFAAIVPATVGVRGCCFDTESIERLQQKLEPLALFGPSSIVSFMHAYAQAQLAMLQGREGEAAERYTDIKRRLHTQEIRDALGEGHWKNLCGGILFTFACLEVYRSGTHALALADEMEELGVRVYAVIAEQIRLLHHAYRGESAQVQVYRDRVEQLAVQGNATWQSELFWPAMLLNGDVLTGDTVAARRTSEQLARRSQEVPSLAVYAQAAHAAYLALRGDLDESIAAYEALLPQLPPKRRVAWLTTRAYFAEALNWAGQHARAKQLLQEALGHTQPSDQVHAVLHLEPRRQLALAEAGLGNHVQAAAQLDQLIAQHGGEDQPLLIGLLHKARAEVALLQRDRERFEHHAAAMANAFRPTQNPALLAQCDQLAARAVRAGLREALTRNETPRGAAPVQQTTQRTVGDITGAPDRSEYALKLVMARTRADAGYLYLLEDGALRLCAASEAHEPPRGLETQLQSLLDAPASGTFVADDPDVRTVIEATSSVSQLAERLAVEQVPVSGRPDADKTVYVPSSPPVVEGGSYQVIPLFMRFGRRVTAVGGLILRMDENRLDPIDGSLLEGLARALYDREG